MPWLHDGTTLCALDARKGRLYAAVWRGQEQVRPPGDRPPEAVLEGLAPGFRAVGEGVLAYRALVEAVGGVVVEAAADPGVASLAALGVAALEAGAGRDPVTVQPTYLRPPDAKPRSSR
jgi:tRNA A37 threonylcarbamoyladenosine modification protein TsaB